MLSRSFLFISEDGAKHYTLQIHTENLNDRKMTVTDHVLSASEPTLLKVRANLPYQEITKKFQRSWPPEDFFCSRSDETNYMSKEHQKCVSLKNSNKIFSLLKISI